MVRQDTPLRQWHQARKARDLRKLEALAAMKHRIDLDDAAVILAVIAEQRPAAYDNAARRWLARLCVEKPFTAWGSENASYDTIARVALALRDLPRDPDGARARLRGALMQTRSPELARAFDP